MEHTKTMGGLGIRGSSDIYHYEKGVHYLQLADWPSESLSLTRCGYHECPPDHSWGPKQGLNIICILSLMERVH